MFDVFYIGKKPGLFAHERAVASIEQAQQLSRTRFFWMINYLADYTGFDFLWEPVPWQAHQRHAWASQWQRDSGTYLVPRQGYADTNYHGEVITMTEDMTLWQNINSVDTFDFSWHPDYTDPVFNYEFGTQWQKTGGPVYPMSGAIETKYVSQSNSKVRAKAQHAYVIDHMDGHTVDIPVKVAKTVRYFDNYKDTLTRIANTCEYEFVWIVSSICDYSKFDFSWHPEAWQNHMLHVFASNGEKFGDTFFMHVPTFRSKIKEFELLDWYDLNFVNISLPRWPMPQVVHNYDTQLEAIKHSEWNGPLAVFIAEGLTVDCATLPVVPLWREKTKTVVPCSPGAGVVVVPKTAVSYIKTQVYDYPYIDKTQKDKYTDQPLDIVFISNGEINADYNYEKLKFHAGDLNRIQRVDRVPGRVAAYHAAAEASTTPWFFAVFAKLEVDYLFNWSWQPDKLQQPKHYIFHARNPVNGLEYGHQAMIAYNQQLTLANTGTGLDFTLDSAHEVVPILSGTAHYHMDPWMCWRTAFREALKLRSSTDVESEYRLRQWIKDCGPRHDYEYAKWSHIGAQDAVEYWESVGGDFAELKKSYDWAWLASYAFVKHNLTLSQ
jgi:hypothetical protein